jgi:hypothetical protein
MKKYNVIITIEAIEDLSNITNVITYDYSSPITAFKYSRGLIETMSNLSHMAESLPIQTRASLKKYGTNVRRINYKKMAIIYTVHGDKVYIHRIIAASLISGI